MPIDESGDLDINPRCPQLEPQGENISHSTAARNHYVGCSIYQALIVLHPKLKFYPTPYVPFFFPEISSIQRIKTMSDDIRMIYASGKEGLVSLDRVARWCAFE